MSGVATHDDDYDSGIGIFKKDFEGELLGPGLNVELKGKGSAVLDALIRGSAAEPKEVKKPMLWKIIQRLYEILPDGDRPVRRNSVSSSVSNMSVSFEDLQDSFARLKEDLLTSLPTLVAPKVSELLAPRDDMIQMTGVEPDVKRNSMPEKKIRFGSVRFEGAEKKFGSV